MLNEHGLTAEAKSELIDVIFSNAADSEKAKSYHLLGVIAFSENKIGQESLLLLFSLYPPGCISYFCNLSHRHSVTLLARI